MAAALFLAELSRPVVDRMAAALYLAETCRPVVNRMSVPGGTLQKVVIAKLQLCTWRNLADSIDRMAATLYLAKSCRPVGNRMSAALYLTKLCRKW